MTSIKDELAERVHAAADDLIALSHRIHAHPETAFEEVRACGWVGDLLEAHGLPVEQGVYELPTALRATIGSGPVHVVICLEYDALPGVGHACGHNVIAAAGAGAGLALAPFVDDLGLTLTVLGTPAEESGGGKIIMLEGGAFDGVDAAMMVHPAPFELDQMPCRAFTPLDVTYRGKAAHASAFPEAGLNAADALTVAQVGIGLLRQHLHPGDRVHGIVRHGGDAPNVVPDQTSGQWYVRAPDLDSLEVLLDRVNGCFRAGAEATGCDVSVESGRTYSHFAHSEELAGRYRSNAEALGRSFAEFSAEALERMAGSTDMANVSQVCPAIHPTLNISSGDAVNHQPEFAAACAAPPADWAALDGATAMAWTCADLANAASKERP
ncbi:M20 family metallopeptidase [Kribbella sancticallisti]|uniref:Peptidase M20 domain-containing protein 2 n=1 Tax=Kribbella sancticallisti TaxID=460087 RepID=A0ABP4NK34_9ACTN